MQIRVRENFFRLRQHEQDQVPWHVIDAAQNVEAVELDIWKVVEPTIQSVIGNSKPVGKMWEEGSFDL
jgi:thymidylate kinase